MKGEGYVHTLALVLAMGAMLCVNGLAKATGGPDQMLVQHQKPTLIERGTSFSLEFTIPAINGGDVADAYLFYKTDGNVAYSQKKAKLVSSTFSARLQINDSQAGELHYYLRIELNNGESIIYPNEASENALTVDIVDPRKTERERIVQQTGIDYTILSPEPGATVSKEEVVIALTLFYESEQMDSTATFSMYVDGEDVTEEANASDYFYSYSTDDLSSGTHKVEFALNKADTSVVLTNWDFSVLAPGQRNNNFAETENRESWIPQGNVELSARNQEVGGYSNDALSGNVRISGQKGNISYSAYGLLTTQEDPRLQPQNRYGVSLYVGNWLDLQAGHIYPTLNQFTIAGQRMQGVNVGLHFWNESLNLRFIYGKLRRGINTLYNNITVENKAFEQAQDPVQSYLLNAKDAGTFEREVVGGRIDVRKNRAFSFGINLLKVEDDTSSIPLINNFSDVMEVNPELAGELSEQQQQLLQGSPDELGVSGNPTPKGNLVASSDLKARFDDNRIQFEADGAVSLLNRDISDGALTQSAADRIGFSIAEDTENLLDQLSWLIIINENMETLPIRFDEGSSDASAEIFFPTSILAGQSKLGFSYFNNDLQFRYRWVGPGYNSLANATVRKDIAGLSVTDRIRLLDNQLYVTIGYENLRDNVVDNKDATTETTNYRGNISWYPVNQSLPNLSMSVMKRSRDNGVGLNNPLVASLGGVTEKAAVQNIIISGADTLTIATPRFSDTYQFSASLSQEFEALGITHGASINYSLLTTTDEVFEYGDSQSQSVSARVVNRFPNSPFQTNVGFNINNSETSGGLSTVKIVGANIGGNLFLLNNKLNIELSLAFTKNKTSTTALLVSDNGTPNNGLDDYYRPASADQENVRESNSYIINSRARYNVNEAHSFLLDFKYSNVYNTLASSVTFPNDHLLQLRYIYNF